MTLVSCSDYLVAALLGHLLPARHENAELVSVSHVARSIQRGDCFILHIVVSSWVPHIKMFLMNFLFLSTFARLSIFMSEWQAQQLYIFP